MIQVILCDDHAVVRRGIKDTLAEAVDIKVVAEAGSYSEAREALRNSPCDVLVLDLNLPMMNGQEMLIEMMSQPLLSSIPVAVLTTSDCEQCVCQLCPPGRCRYFTKTDDFAHLQGIVRQIEQHARSHLG